jgi:NADPH-dependent 2,4-dienoyl-CoA reductase/sulfur reductase-like enzyme
MSLWHGCHAAATRRCNGLSWNRLKSGHQVGFHVHRRTELPSGTVIETDIAIIGAGAAGITLARELRESGRRSP